MDAIPSPDTVPATGVPAAVETKAKPTTNQRVRQQLFSALAYRAQQSGLRSLVVENIDEVVTQEGKWQLQAELPTSSGEDGYAVWDAIEPTLQKLSGWLDIVADNQAVPVLSERDAALDVGYNRHDIEHHKYVHDGTIAFISDLEHIDGNSHAQAKYLGALMAVGHDVGMLADLYEHAGYSAELLGEIFPTLHDPEYASIFTKVKLGIELHDASLNTPRSPRNVLQHWLLGEPLSDSFTSEEQAIIDDPDFRLAFCAFMQADKTDIAPRRISTAFTNQEQQLADDPFRVVESMGRTIRTGVGSNGGYEWDLGYKPKLTLTEQREYHGLIEEFRGEITFDRWVDLLLQYHGSRVINSGLFALAASDAVTDFTLAVQGAAENERFTIALPRSELAATLRAHSGQARQVLEKYIL